MLPWILMGWPGRDGEILRTYRRVSVKDTYIHGVRRSSINLKLGTLRPLLHACSASALLLAMVLRRSGGELAPSRQ